ncbi:hypothetical protein BDV40DRAFT_303074 [Aspergillus tamarii]|uniref:Epoxide hydrolase N-terminal domain-containing protein n=1 Tax=Aspergillus tamarii TaxID=41984 RepID=A0A5N6UM55_ASPTM|nr:hypothetical protein BDV40DRAFT_303074 [Aspergillus tamarii]
MGTVDTFSINVRTDQISDLKARLANILLPDELDEADYALTDSPVALLAWSYEKLHDWSDNYPWSEEEVCTWISIYWFSTAGPGGSLRIYYGATYMWEDSAPNKVTRARTEE